MAISPSTPDTTAAALSYGPLRQATTAVARRAVHGVRLTPAEVLRTFAERAAQGVQLDELLLQLADVIRAGSKDWSIFAESLAALVTALSSED